MRHKEQRCGGNSCALRSLVTAAHADSATGLHLFECESKDRFARRLGVERRYADRGDPLTVLETHEVTNLSIKIAQEEAYSERLFVLA